LGVIASLSSLFYTLYYKHFGFHLNEEMKNEMKKGGVLRFFTTNLKKIEIIIRSHPIQQVT
jgi:hypothetical protein